MDINKSYTILTIASILCNCVMIMSLCCVAIIKGWWAVLLLIPLCFLSPSLKTEVEEDKDGKQ